MLLDRICGKWVPFTDNSAEDNSGQWVFFPLLVRECHLVLPCCDEKIHNLQLCFQHQSFVANNFSKSKQLLCCWFFCFSLKLFWKVTFGLCRFGKFTTFYFFSSKNYVKRYVNPPISSTSRRGISCLISQNLSAILSQICYLYCPSANVLSLPCTLL